MYACMYVRIYLWMYLRMQKFYVDLCLYVCSYVFMNAHMCVSMSPHDDDIYQT